MEKELRLERNETNKLEFSERELKVKLENLRSDWKVDAQKLVESRVLQEAYQKAFQNTLVKLKQAKKEQTELYAKIQSLEIDIFN